MTEKIIAGALLLLAATILYWHNYPLVEIVKY
jgi:hypothetical protein